MVVIGGGHPELVLEHVLVGASEESELGQGEVLEHATALIRRLAKRR